MKSNQTELLPHVQTSLLQISGPSQALDHPARPQTHLEHIEKLQTHIQVSLSIYLAYGII